MARARWPSWVPVLVVAGATGLWSCGGGANGPTAPVEKGRVPVAAVPGEDDDGGVTASAADKVAVCHKGREIEVPSQVIDVHLRHGDRLGSCAVACPCFTATQIEQLAAQCTGTPHNTCPTLYSIDLFCIGSSAGHLGTFAVAAEAGTCSTTLINTTGEFVTTSLPVTQAEFEACRQAIVGSSPYPDSCLQ
jgi:hypothetical protein